MTLARATPLVEIGESNSVELGTGWRITRPRGLDAILAAISCGTGLVLIHTDTDVTHLVEAIRASDRVAGAVPVLVIAKTPDTNLVASATADLCVDETAAGGIAAILVRWRPIQLPDAYFGVESAFGKAVVDDMARRLCAVLADALDAIGAPDVAEVAHRVAGVAGTLGFSALGRRWLALSQGDAVDLPELRRETRRTIAAIVLRTMHTAAVL